MTDKQFKQKEENKKIRKTGTELIDLLTEKDVNIGNELIDELSEVLTKIDRKLFYNLMGYENGREVITPTEMDAERWKNKQELGINNIPFMEENKEDKEE